MAWAIDGTHERRVCAANKVSEVSFRHSVRARFIGASLLLLLIPLSGFLFVRELATYLRLGQEQVAIATAKLVAASLSDRPELQLRRRPVPSTDDAPSPVDSERDRVIALFAASDAGIAASLGARYLPDAGVERILNQGVARDARVWVIDLAGNVRGLAGALYQQHSLSWPERTSAGALRWLTGTRPTGGVNDIIDSREAVFAQAERTLIGQPNIEWRSQPDLAFAVISAGEPVWQGDSIVAAVVIEQSDTSQRTLARRAAQSVITVSLMVFLVAFSVLVWFAFGLSRRIARLQKQANAAVDGQGRAAGSIDTVTDRDELGALSRTLAAMVARQARYNSYLEQLAARLSHELRTPVAVVRSSLDNLRASDPSHSDATYLDRAEEGVDRLSTLISRMSEATQLERMLHDTDRVRLDLAKLVDGCVDGYRLAFAPRIFTMTRSAEPVWVRGAPDAIAQMLDKLTQNAVDFATAETPIEIRVMAADKSALLEVSNTGPPLPADASSLFESMVSLRQGPQTEGHLGLGLYIARLIAEFHRGHINAKNRADCSGVLVRVTMPTDLPDRM